MPGHGIQQGAKALCAHGGTAQPTMPNPRVRLAGAAAIALPTPWMVSGCPFPPASGGPCVTAMWTTGSVRVTSMGQPLVIQGGSATCVPTGTPLTTVGVQLRVRLS